MLLLISFDVIDTVLTQVSLLRGPPACTVFSIGRPTPAAIKELMQRSAKRQHNHDFAGSTIIPGLFALLSLCTLYPHAEIDPLMVDPQIGLTMT